MSRFLVYTAPAVGHVLPLVPGILELQRRGHEVHVRTLPSLVGMLQELGIDAAPVAPEVVDVPVTDFEATTDAERLAKGYVDLMERGRHDGPDLERAIADFHPDALVVDVISYGAQTRAEASGLPWALSMPSLAPFREPGIPPYGLGLRPSRSPLGRVRDALLWPLVLRHFGKALLPGYNALRSSAGLPPHSSPLDIYSSAPRVLVMTGPPLEYPRSQTADNISFVGFQLWDTPGTAPSYLTEPGDPWVLVTCSSDYQGDEELARVAVEALADEPVRVLVTLGHDRGAPSLPSSPNVHVEQFVSHGEVLPHAAAVVCHGGMGIVAKSMGAGVPIVCVPFGRDQPEIGRRVAESGAGVLLKHTQLTADRLRDAVRLARGLADPAGRAAKLMAEHSGPGPLADAVEGLVRNGHPSPC